MNIPLNNIDQDICLLRNIFILDIIAQILNDDWDVVKPLQFGYHGILLQVKYI